MINEFEKNGYIIFRNFLNPEFVPIISRYMEYRLKRDSSYINNSSSKSEDDPITTLRYYGDPLVEVVLREQKEIVEQAIGESLYPTYSYLRIYQPGEELKRHVDRPSCEVSVTVNVAYKGDNNPIFMKKQDKEPSQVYLEPGDAVIYKGMEISHWREPLEESQLIVQFMLHYVKTSGDCSIFKYDGRSSLGQPRDETNYYKLFKLYMEQQCQ